MPARLIARIATLLALILLGVPGPVAADPNPPVGTFTWSPNMEPLGYAPHPPPASGQFNSDIAFWGDTAYQGTYRGFQIIDISNPEDPQTITDFDDCRGNQGDVIIWDDILVRSWNSPTTSLTATCDGDAVTLGFEGLHIFDVSNPLNPDLLAQVNIPGCGSHTATGVPDLENDRLLVYNNPSAGGNCAGFDVVEVPLSDPENPVNLGHISTGRSCHDTAVILGDAMLAACAGGNGFTVLGLGGTTGGTLTAPQQLYSKTLEGVSIGHAASFSWDGSVLIFGHEPGGGGQPQCQASSPEVNKTLFFFASADGAELGRMVLPRPQTDAENCTIHNFNVVPSARRNVLVSGNYQSGISVVDFTNPANPQEIGYADPAPLDPEALGGDWSTHWYDGFIYESDITRGLLTWRLNDPVVTSAQTLGHLNPQTQESTIDFAPDDVCKKKPVTIFGTSEDDLLRGTTGRDVFLLEDGDDVVRAGKGRDIVCGGEGKDLLLGQRGNDLLFGQQGKDGLVGGRGRDLCSGGPKKDKGKRCERGKV